MTLKTMPKVGDKVRYIGACTSKLTYLFPYEIDSLSSAGNAIFYDDNGEKSYITGFEFSEYALVTEENPQPAGFVRIYSYDIRYDGGKREVGLTVDSAGFAAVKRLVDDSRKEEMLLDERRAIEQQIAQLQRKLEALK